MISSASSDDEVGPENHARLIPEQSDDIFESILQADQLVVAQTPATAEVADNHLGISTTLSQSQPASKHQINKPHRVDSSEPTCLVLLNLHSWVSDTDIKHFLSTRGAHLKLSLKSIRFAQDMNTGQSRGVAMCKFASEAQAKTARELFQAFLDIEDFGPKKVKESDNNISHGESAVETRIMSERTALLELKTWTAEARSENHLANPMFPFPMFPLPPPPHLLFGTQNKTEKGFNATMNPAVTLDKSTEVHHKRHGKELPESRSDKAQEHQKLLPAKRVSLSVTTDNTSRRSSDSKYRDDEHYRSSSHHYRSSSSKRKDSYLEHKHGRDSHEQASSRNIHHGHKARHREENQRDCREGSSITKDHHRRHRHYSPEPSNKEERRRSRDDGRNYESNNDHRHHRHHERDKRDTGREESRDENHRHRSHRRSDESKLNRYSRDEIESKSSKGHNDSRENRHNHRRHRGDKNVNADSSSHGHHRSQL